MYGEDRVYFSVATKIDLLKNISLSMDVIHKIVDFSNEHLQAKLMFCYTDKKGDKKPAVNEKSFAKLEAAMRETWGHYLNIQDYLTAKEYYSFSCDIDLPAPILEANLSNYHDDYIPNNCDIVSVSIFRKYAEKTDVFPYIMELFQCLQAMLNGTASFITHGCDNWHSIGLFDARYYATPRFFSVKWDEYVRGYYWGMVLNSKQLETIGGIRNILNHGFFYQMLNDGKVFIQCTENLWDYKMEHALKMRDLVLPLFPPKSEYKGQPFTSEYHWNLWKKNGCIILFDSEDVL